MKKPEIPIDEKARQKALEHYELLDSLAENTFDDLTLIASQICQTPIALISLIDNDRQWFKSKLGFDLNETHRDVSFCGHAINDPHEVFVINNTLDDERFQDNPLVTGENEVRFYAGVPLVDQANYALGTICVMDNEPKELSEGQVLAMKALSREVMNRIQIRKHTLSLENKLSEKDNLQILLENNAQYLSLIEFAPLGIVVSNLSGKIIQTNKMFEDMLGYSKGELEKMRVSDITFPGDVEETKKNLFKLKIGESRNFTMEKRYFHKNKSIVWGRVSSSFIPDVYNNPAYLIGTIDDITESKRRDEEYLINAERLDLAIKGANDGIWDQVDMESDKEWWSPRYHELLGYKEGEIEPSYTSFRNILLHPDDVHLLDNGMKDCLEKGIPLDIEHRLRCKDGVFRWFRGKGNATRDDSGKPIRMTGSITSIGKQKELELKLSETQRFLKKVMEIAPSIIYVFDQRNMSNEYSNREVGNVLGYSVKEIQEMGDQLIPTICHPEDLQKVFQHFEKIKTLENNETVSVEYRMRNKIGEYRWLLSEDIVFERDKEEKVIKHLGVATDISELKKSQQDLQKQAEQLRSRNEELKQFAYIATHDLKNPIITLKGHFDYLKSNMLGKTEEVEESIEYIDEEIQQFNTTIGELIKAINLREVEIEKQSLEINDVIHGICSSFKSQLEKIEGELYFDLEEEIKVEGTEIYLTSIISNLVSNAIKYKSKRKLQIKIKSRKIDKWLELVVKDNGNGINLELHQHRIFKMFNRFDDRVEGSGMGLYMAKNMIEKIGGSIRLESKEGEGTSFYLRFLISE